MPARKVHLMNEAQRDATLAMVSVREPAPPKQGLPGMPVVFVRYVAAAESGLLEALQAVHGDELAAALVAGDPEIDLELVGRHLGDTTPVVLAGDGGMMHASPTVVDVVFGPDGSERDRKPASDTPSNVNVIDALRPTGRRIAKAEAIRRFAFRRTVEIRHTDGLTFDFLFAMAKQLADEGTLAMVGGGPRGKDPLVFQDNGAPYRGFLEGRVDGERYMLLLHLSNLELRAPS